MDQAFNILMQYKVLDIALFREGHQPQHSSGVSIGEIMKLPVTTLSKLVRFIILLTVS